MRFERIDDKTVKCYISNEELEEYQIDYKDFLTRSEKAKEIVQEIMEQAAEEVGYKPPQLAFDLQIMMLPDQGLLLTFSEKDPLGEKDGAKILECLQEMKQALLKTKDQLGMTQAAGGETVALSDSISPEGTGAKQEQKEKSPKTRPNKVVFVFESIGRVMEYAAVLPANLRVGSVLYAMNEKYYLYLTKGTASYERYSRACIQGMEFCEFFFAEEDRLLYLEEHGETLIADHAIKKLTRG